MDGVLSESKHEALISAARATVGEELRSITYFSDEMVEQIYLREDLDQTADLVGFAEIERGGFVAQEKYHGTQLGEYQFTIRVFDQGYLTRVIVGDHGVWVTTDEMSIDRFEELAAVLLGVLEEF